MIGPHKKTAQSLSLGRINIRSLPSDSAHTIDAPRHNHITVVLPHDIGLEKVMVSYAQITSVVEQPDVETGGETEGG